MGLQMRKKQNGVWPWLNGEPHTRPLWFHCSSGEFEYAKPVLRELKAKYPQEKILVTYFSPSVKKSVASCQEVDFSCPLPWDEKKLWDEFLKFHLPKGLFIARTDLWPMMILRTHHKKIPMVLFSKTSASPKKGLARWMEKKLLRKLSAIFCVTSEDRDNLLKLIGDHVPVHAAGDTRYDQVIWRLSHPKNLKPLNNFHRPIFVAGSTWAGDEDILLPVIETLGREISFVIAPHEPSDKHLTALAKKLRSKDLDFSWYSQTQSWDPMKVLIIDEVGILADLYRWSLYSFIGGSMDRSVHSVMEPLAQGNLCFVGPNHHNNREALHFKDVFVDGWACVQETHSAKDFIEKLSNIYLAWTSASKEQLKREVTGKTGSSQILIRWIESQVLSTYDSENMKPTRLDESPAPSHGRSYNP
ncbi:MAG: hypothetical protein KDD33_12210 [Bdellovibrionales bacterium]|nr:hypothetical protein [Bdellovibrionales bacterium]